MRIAALTLWLAALGAAFAGTIQFPPHLADAEFLRQWRGSGNVQSARTLEEQRYAQGYLDAVVDLTQGRDWCSPDRMEPVERDDRVTTALAKHPAGTNAAQSLLAHYRTLFPCQ